MTAKYTAAAGVEAARRHPNPGRPPGPLRAATDDELRTTPIATLAARYGVPESAVKWQRRARHIRSDRSTWRPHRDAGSPKGSCVGLVEAIRASGGLHPGMSADAYGEPWGACGQSVRRWWLRVWGCPYLRPASYDTRLGRQAEAEEIADRLAVASRVHLDRLMPPPCRCEVATPLSAVVAGYLAEHRRVVRRHRRADWRVPA